MINKTIEKELKEKFSSLQFNEEPHTYELELSDTSINLPSVSSKIANFYEPFDRNISKYVAKSKGITQEEVLKEWDKKRDDSCNYGTKIHTFGQNYVLSNIKPSNNSELGIVQWWMDLPNYYVPVALELPMFSVNYKYAGTPDLILMNNLTGNLIIGDYKGLPLDTNILTDSGWKTMGTLELSDKVYDKNGELSKIKAISEIHNKKCLKINFDNSESIISDFEHRWLISFIKNNKQEDKVMTTQEINDYLIEMHDIYGKNIPGYKLPKIMNTKPLQGEDIELPIDPYVLGIWLADGHSADSKVTQANPLVWKEIEKRGYILGDDVSRGGSGKAQTRSILGIAQMFKKLNLYGNKHLPELYLKSSFKQRLDLLRGFMDGDGYYNKTRKRFVMSTTKMSQVDFSVELASSLGLKCTILPCIKNCNNKKIQGWDVCFTTNEFNPFLTRNQDIKLKTNNTHKYRRIKSVEETNQVPTKCIEVESDTHTFLATKSFIVTHNTNEDLFKNHKGKKLLEPFKNLLDNPFNKYQLQFSHYQICLEDMGYSVEDRILIWLTEDNENMKFYKQYRTDDFTIELREYYG